MKTSHLAAVPAVVFSMTLSLVSSSIALAGNGNGNNGNGNGNQPKEPLIPVGTLDAFPTLVQTGTHPTLTWDIQYPEAAPDVVTVDPDVDTVTPNTDLCMEVTVLGASYQIGTRRGKPVWGYVQAQVRVGGGSWNQFFYNTQDKVKPNQTYFSSSVPAGQEIDFRARSYNGSRWLDWRSTGYQTENVIALVNGQRPPSTIPAFNQGNIESFLDPYLDAGGYINIGPKDVIYLIELGQTNTSSSGFDLQDLVVLASFDYCKNNNGHGNNVDGVDVSNPGQGGGGPNGEDDPSGNIDDEIR